MIFRPPLVFADADYVVPDLAVLPSPRTPHASTGRTGPLAQFVVEVLSEFTETRDRGIKRERCAHFGVPEYWIIDPDRRRVEVYRLQEDRERSTVVTDRLRWQPVDGGGGAGAGRP